MSEEVQDLQYALATKPMPREVLEELEKDLKWARLSMNSSEKIAHIEVDGYMQWVTRENVHHLCELAGARMMAYR